MADNLTYLLGVDFGGGASKATLMSSNGKIAATAACEYPTDFPEPGQAEQNPLDWYTAACENIRSVLTKSGVNPAQIEAVAFDAATHTAVLCDEDMNVLRPSIYWTDSRSISQTAFLRDHFGDVILEQTLHNPDTIWTLPQLLWIKENEPEIWSKTKRILFAKDYVRYLFTGEYCTDFIEAEGSMLFDYNRKDWSPELCGVLDFPINQLPKLCKPTDMIGNINSRAAADCGLKKGTPVICGTTDTVMEVFASGAVSSGQMTVKLATAGRICVITENPFPHKHLINYSHVAEGLWYPGTATKSCAASYRWYRDTFGEDYKALDLGAASVAPGADGLIFHPYLNGELTPYADPLLRGSFTGVTSGHTKSHFSRAVLEGVAFSLLDCKKTIEEIGLPHKNNATIIGGGAASPLWRQIVSDVLGLSLRQNETADSSFGSAMLAGIAAGVFLNINEAVWICTKQVSVTSPEMENNKKYAEIFPYYKEIQRALAPVYHKM